MIAKMLIPIVFILLAILFIWLKNRGKAQLGMEETGDTEENEEAPAKKKGGIWLAAKSAFGGIQNATRVVLTAAAMIAILYLLANNQTEYNRPDIKSDWVPAPVKDFWYYHGPLGTPTSSHPTEHGLGPSIVSAPEDGAMVGPARLADQKFRLTADGVVQWDPTNTQTRAGPEGDRKPPERPILKTLKSPPGALIGIIYSYSTGHQATDYFFVGSDAIFDPQGNHVTVTTSQGSSDIFVDTKDTFLYVEANGQKNSRGYFTVTVSYPKN